MTRDALRPLASPLAWTLFIALPVAGWGWFDGLPIGWLEAGAIALVWWAWAGDRQLPGMRVLAGLTVVKLALGALLVGGGFAARYYANDAWAPPLERSTEFRRGDITRQDERLAFGGADQPDLPLHFLNHLRFNFYRSEEPQRDRLAYSVVWEGFLRGNDPPEEVTLYLAVADGVAGELLVDARPIVVPDGTFSPRAGSVDGRRAGPVNPPERTGSVTLSPGWHPITIRVAAPYGSGRRVEAGGVVNGMRRPFDKSRVLIAPATSTRLAVDAAVRWLARVIDLVVLSSLGALLVMRARKAWRDLRVGRLLWLAVITEALLFALPYAGRAAVLTGGDDWLMYEHLARAIAFGDPLLREPGLGAGQGTPFYFQVLYPYFVALTHLLFGDGIFGVAFVQRLLLGAATGWIAATATRLFGERTGWVALGIGGLLMYAKGGRWAAVLLAEPLFTPLLVWWAWLLVRTATEAPRWPRLVLTGAIGGLATLVRSTLFLALPVVLPLWSASVRPRRARATAVLVASLVAVLGVLTLRTWIVAGTFALVPRNGPITLLMGNEPPRPLDAAPPGRTAVYNDLRLAAHTRTVIEYAFQLPGEFIGNLARKAVYTVGLFERSGIEAVGVRVPDASWVYVALWCGALAGVVRLLRTPAGFPWQVVLLPALLALSHFAAVVLILPYWYGDRLILPLYPLLVPYAAFAVEPIALWQRTRVWRVAPILLATLTLAIFFSASPRSSDVVMLLILAAAILAFSARRQPITPRHRWLYLGYAATFLVLMFVRPAGAGDDLEMRRYLLLPLVAFAVGQLAGHEVTHRATLAALVIGPLFTREAAGRFAISRAADPFLWVVAGMVTVPLSLLAGGRLLTGRAAAALATGCLVMALLLPFLPGVDADLTSQLGDIRRDFGGMTAGNPQARQELIGDVGDAVERIVEPFAAVFSIFTGNAGIFGTLCLLAVSIQVLVSGRHTYVENPRTSAVSYAVLFAALLAALAGSRAEVWGGNGYPLAALAILFGLAHARFAGAPDWRAVD